MGSQADVNDDNDEDYLVDHSIVFYLLDPQGEFLEFYTQKTLAVDIVKSISNFMSSAPTK